MPAPKPKHKGWFKRCVKGVKKSGAAVDAEAVCGSMLKKKRAKNSNNLKQHQRPGLRKFDTEKAAWFFYHTSKGHTDSATEPKKKGAKWVVQWDLSEWEPGAGAAVDASAVCGAVLKKKRGKGNPIRTVGGVRVIDEYVSGIRSGEHIHTPWGWLPVLSTSSTGDFIDFAVKDSKGAEHSVRRRAFSQVGHNRMMMPVLYSGRTRGAKRNPASTSAAMYESFHGRPSGEIVEVQEQEHYHGHLAALGELVSIKVRTVSGYDVELGFESGSGGRERNPTWGIGKERKAVLVNKEIVFTGNDRESENIADKIRKARTAGTVDKKAFIETTWLRAGSGAQRGWWVDPSRFGIKSNPKSKRSGVKGWLTRRTKAMGDIGNSFMKTWINPRNPHPFPDPKRVQDLKNCIAEGEAKLRHGKDIAGKKFTEAKRGWIVRTIEDCKQKLAVELRKGNPRGRRNPSPALLCSNESGDSLYIEGGDQSLDLKAIHMSGDWERDSMVIGDIREITYRTAKHFDRFETIDYYHQLSEESKRALPELIYDTMNQKLSISGGVYRVKPEGIVD